MIVERGFQRVIGTSGTILSLGGVVVQAETGSSVDDIRNCRVSSKGLHKLRKQLVESDLQERLQIPASIRAAPTSRSRARCCSIRSCAGSAPKTSRCAISRCAKD